MNYLLFAKCCCCACFKRDREVCWRRIVDWNIAQSPQLKAVVVASAKRASADRNLARNRNVLRRSDDTNAEHNVGCWKRTLVVDQRAEFDATIGKVGVSVGSKNRRS